MDEGQRRMLRGGRVCEVERSELISRKGRIMSGQGGCYEEGSDEVAPVVEVKVAQVERNVSKWREIFVSGGKSF